MEGRVVEDPVVDIIAELGLAHAVALSEAAIGSFGAGELILSLPGPDICFVAVVVMVERALFVSPAQLILFAPMSRNLTPLISRAAT